METGKPQPLEPGQSGLVGAPSSQDQTSASMSVSTEIAHATSNKRDHEQSMRYVPSRLIEKKYRMGALIAETRATPTANVTAGGRVQACEMLTRIVSFPGPKRIEVFASDWASSSAVKDGVLFGPGGVCKMHLAHRMRPARRTSEVGGQPSHL